MTPRFIHALRFAAKAHQTQTRKGTDVPYIVHPFAVAWLLHEAGFEEDLVIASLLHDTLEDAKVPVAELRQRFGERIAAIVEGCSEPDKAPPWEERKKHSLQSLPAASWEVRAVVCADKLHNVLEMRIDHGVLGEALWKRFEHGREQQAWYYNGVVQALSCPPYHPQVAPLLERLRAEVDLFFNHQLPPPPSTSASVSSPSPKPTSV